jgi:hypothetical protein
VANSSASRAFADAIAALLGAPTQLASALTTSLPQRLSGGCEIPPPCWEPRPIGRCELLLPPGGSGTVRVHVENCGWSRQLVGITAGGWLASWLTFEPTTLMVGPQERAAIRVIVRVPDSATAGQSVAGPLLVRGCLDHVAHLTVRVAECSQPPCCDLFVRDCPDHVHHWYDHFYCPRPCRPGKSTRGLQDG